MATRVVTRIGRLVVTLLMLAKLAHLQSCNAYTLRAIEEAERMLSSPRPVVNGRMVMEKLGIKPGPLVGKLKQQVYEVKPQYGINNPDKIVEILRNKLLNNNG